MSVLRIEKSLTCNVDRASRGGRSGGCGGHAPHLSGITLTQMNDFQGGRFRIFDDTIMFVVGHDRLSMVKPFDLWTRMCHAERGEMYGDLNGSIFHRIDRFQRLERRRESEMAMREMLRMYIRECRSTGDVGRRCRRRRRLSRANEVNR